MIFNGSIPNITYTYFMICCIHFRLSHSFNNEFRAIAHNIKDFKMYIFNRWGELVFESTDVKYSWNGKVKNSGNDCPEGTYFYVIKYMFEFDDKSETIEGTVDIIR